MTTEPTGLPRPAHPAAPWSTPVHTQHAGTTLTGPQPRLLDRAWSYEPEFCLPGIRVVALRVADGTFVCPLCGVRTS